MKKIAPFLSLLFISTGLFPLLNAQAQEKDYEGFTVSPQPLRWGKKIDLKLDASKNNLLSVGEPIYAVMLAYRSGKAQAFDFEMKRAKKDIYTARFTVPDSVDAIAFRFLQGARESANNGRGFVFSVLDASGNSLPGTLLSKYQLHAGDINAGISKGNPELARKYHDKWFAQQDPERMPFLQKVMALSYRKDTAALCRLLADLPHVPGLSEGQFSNLNFYFRPCGKEALAVLDAEMKRRYPKGNWYWRPWLDSLRQLRTIPEKMVWTRAFQMAFPEDQKKDYPLSNDMYLHILQTASNELDLGTMNALANRLAAFPETADRIQGAYSNILTLALAKDTLKKELFPIVEKSLRQSEWKLNNPPAPRAGQSIQAYRRELYRNYLNFASLYGACQESMGAYDSAAHYTRMAAAYHEWKNPLYNERYFRAAEKLPITGELLENLKTAFRQEGYTNSIKEIFLRVYEKTGRGDGNAVLKELLFERKSKLLAGMKEKMVSRPAPAFTLPGLNGGETSLASLRGKVVLLDFWATWCSPCIASFPSMQQLVYRYKDNPDVAILFVDTWQKETDKYQAVREFFRNKPYRFDVLMDLDDKVVKDYGISGIPTKIIIDKKGVIRFVSVGFYGNDVKGTEELEAMIELAEAS